MKNVPLARAEHLIVQDLSDEMIVYDQTKHRAIHLGPEIAFVWRHCDGATPPSVISNLLEIEFNMGSGQAALAGALERLEKHGLVQAARTLRAKARAA